MDLFNMMAVTLIVPVLTNVDATVLVSLFTRSAEDLQCTLPFLQLYTIGYIRCQKECIRYSICDVLEYNKDLLECYLYMNTTCVTTSQSPADNIFMRRTDIKETLIGACQLNGCPESACVSLREGGHKCVIDRVVSHCQQSSVTFVDIEGLSFGLFRATEKEFRAKQTCKLYNGRLAVLNTPRKFAILAASLLQVDDKKVKWWVGAYRNASGDVRWTTGELVPPINIHESNEYCYTVFKGDKLDDSQCGVLRPYVCEI